MKRLFCLAVILTSSVSFAEVGLLAKINLSPAGSFQAKSSSVNGTAKASGDSFSAANIRIPLNSISTGISLRDQHMKEKHLETAKYPDAILVKAIGKGGKGKGLLKIKDIQKTVSGTYKVINGGRELEASFPIKLSDYNITGIKYMGVGVKDEVLVTVTVPVSK